MARRSKQEDLSVMWPRYQRGGWVERSALLVEVIRMWGDHRTYAIGLLNGRHPPRRRRIYSDEAISMLD